MSSHHDTTTTTTAMMIPSSRNGRKNMNLADRRRKQSSILEGGGIMDQCSNSSSSSSMVVEDSKSSSIRNDTSQTRKQGNNDSLVLPMTVANETEWCRNNYGEVNTSTATLSSSTTATADNNPHDVTTNASASETTRIHHPLPPTTCIPNNHRTRQLFLDDVDVSSSSIHPANNDSSGEREGANNNTDSIVLPLGIGGIKRKNNSSKPSSAALFGSSISSSQSRRSNHHRLKSGVYDSIGVRDLSSSSGGGTSTLTNLSEDYPVPDTIGRDNASITSDLAIGDGISTMDNKSSKHADWYDPVELAAMEKMVTMNKTVEGNGTNETSSSHNKKSRGGQRRGGDVNDNFVRLDMRNAAGSCRGARNMKKVNKQKLWRAQHRFGMNDDANNGNSSDVEVGGSSGGLGEPVHSYGNFAKHSRGGGREKRDGGDMKCFSALQNAGVDPLDDYVDGVFSKKDGEKDATSFNNGRSGKDESAIMRDGCIPICTRHQRPCKLLTVKRNNKGNKGRKFYVCPMPKGEQCDFFKWEEDTVEVRLYSTALNQ